MKLKHWIVAVLLRLYPRGWRHEYGPELADMLLSRPLTARIVGNVLRNGMRQRLWAPEPSTILGFAMLLVVLAGFMGNIASPLPYDTSLEQSQRPLVRKDSAPFAYNGYDLIVLLQHPLNSELYVLVLVTCGFWTYLRHGGRSSSAGQAAMRLTFIAGIPVMLAGFLMLVGVLRVAVLGPGDPPTTFQEHGFTYTYYSVLHHRPSALGVLVSPLLRLPHSWIWGAVGGLLGRGISNWRRERVTAS